MAHKNHKHKGGSGKGSRKPSHPPAAAMPGANEFSGAEEQAMRQGMRGARGAPPTDGSMPPPSAGQPEAEPDVGDPNEAAEGE